MDYSKILLANVCGYSLFVVRNYMRAVLKWCGSCGLFTPETNQHRCFYIQDYHLMTTKSLKIPSKVLNISQVTLRFVMVVEHLRNF